MLFSRWKNDRSSRVAAATVEAKREHVSRQAYCRTCAVQPSEMVKSFYVTFRLGSGEEMELQVPEQVYGAVTKGDRGELTFQGTKFVNFERR